MIVNCKSFERIYYLSEPHNLVKNSYGKTILFVSFQTFVWSCSEIWLNCDGSGIVVPVEELPCTNLDLQLDKCTHALHSYTCLFPHTRSSNQCLQLHQALECSKCLPCLSNCLHHHKPDGVFIFCAYIVILFS